MRDNNSQIQTLLLTKKEKKVFCVLPGEDAHAHVDAHVDAHANAHDDEDDDILYIAYIVCICRSSLL